MVLENQDSKGSQNNNVVMGEDMISELTDALLLHILSFVPIHCVASTSILSKRWRYLWTSIPVLDFRQWPFHHVDSDDEDWWLQHDLETKRFMTFVDKMLSSLDNGSCIQKFCIKYDETFDTSRVSEWITTVIGRNVEELYLSIEVELVWFPTCFYTCESLTRLDVTTHAILNVPESIFFPRLKTLRLTNVTFVDENTTQQFFSNCPVLEDLTLIECFWEDLNVLSISAPALKVFCIIGQRFSNIGLGNCVVKIYAPSLLSFSYWDGSAKDYVLHSFPSLVHADIDLELSTPLKREDIGYGASKLLGGLSNVKLLKTTGEIFEEGDFYGEDSILIKILARGSLLCGYMTRGFIGFINRDQALSFADDLLTNLPTFYNLIHLEVRSRFPPPADRTLFEFIQISPNLESLVFAQCFDHLSDDEDSSKLNLVPQFLLLHLKSVEFRAFDGNTRELKVVKLFLENAVVLERMTITFRKNKIDEVMEQLLMFPRGSTSCASSQSQPLLSPLCIYHAWYRLIDGFSRFGCTMEEEASVLIS